MRVVWAACGLAVAASALTGVLVGVYIHGVDDGQKAEPPASTWITNRSATSATSTEPTSTPTTDGASAPKASTSAPKTTTTTQATTTTEATTPPPPPPPPSPTTTKVKKTEWPCGPLNPLPPPQCD
ncbi:hypothetical protein [Saccharothrix variisporea]|uniref:Uncharacterized protein n=1 Tax=Saccharothrix variisporea TaxID=543527 RepID=A0A495XJJ8_9PSEU|nr:hypothetical protein [Saccharothrix variisporea]RKT73325.1 hypothetical protein DFJ66_6655 [Saccharothrix variisporea]